MYKYLTILLLTCASLMTKGANRDTVKVELKPNAKQSLAMKVVAKLLENENYKRIPLNDSLSTLVFNRYVNALDPNRTYFTQVDITEFQKFKTLLDDDLETGNLAHAFLLFNTYLKNSTQCYLFAIGEINKVIDYSAAETIVPFREDAVYFANQTELRDFWRKKVKYDMLSLKLTGTKDTEAKNILIKRYKNLIFQTQKLTSEDAFQTYMGAVTAAVDPHTAYFTPFNASQFNVTMSRTLEGIGATLNMENEMVTIKDITVGGPAFKTGQISKGDRILAVAQGVNGAFEDIIGWRINESVGLIRGEKGSIVRLKILPAGKAMSDQPKLVSVTRDKIILEDQSAKKSIRQYSTGEKVNKIGFINVPQFYVDRKAMAAKDPNYKSTTRDVKLLIDSLKAEHIDGLVIDLRGNGGGSLTEAIDLTGLFIRTGPVVQLREINGKANVQRDGNPLVSYDGPLAVLVDRASASASEIFSAAIQDYHRGLIIGSQTYGKGTVQTQVDLDQLIASTEFKQEAADLIKADPPIEGAAPKKYFGQFNLTVGKFYRISGRSTQHMGVSPDITLPSLIRMKDYGEDNEVSALPWDTIAKTEYKTAPEMITSIHKLNRLHNLRFASSGLNQYLKETLNQGTKTDLKKPIPLKLSELKRLTDLREENDFKRTNLLRKEMGKPKLVKGQTEKIPSDLDFEKQEAGQVLSDFIINTIG